ncbi:hypothetical protein BGZ63DRAFT_390521 [Mariannaea sp. PMI_226]|nr:hypothetical protein BGZ63DRAFT_390521 [Mariannaea sp. PMI_226]
MAARKLGIHNEPSNLQQRADTSKEEEQKLYCWAAIGYDFKSPLVWYKTPTNSDGKMIQKACLKKILEPFVKK